jgi:hypothetical protein
MRGKWGIGPVFQPKTVMKMSRGRKWCLLSMLGFAGVADCPLGSGATTLLVWKNTDAGAGSLRQAVNDNNGLGGSNTIVFSNSVTGTITLTGGELLITKDVTIVGPGVSVLTVSGNTNGRVFNITDTNTVVSISGLSLVNGTVASASGGCVQNFGKLTLSGCVLSNNNGGGVYGAAIGNEGQLTISNSIVCSNRSAFASGGGIFHHNGTATIINSTFYGNAGFQGGALNIQLGLTMSLTNCTVFGNEGDGGGGFYNAGQLFLRNCTVVSNRANSAFANNAGGGGGIYNSPGSGLVNVGSTIIAGNSTGTNTGHDCYGTNFVSAGYNLISRSNGSTNWNGVGDQVGTISGPLIPALGPLQDNGGPTPTLAPLPGSLAIDQGKTIVATDQRGRLRPADFSSVPNAAAGDGSDIGAVEFWPDSPLLNIQRTGTNVVLSWPVAAIDFRLQSVTNLVASNSWAAVGGAPGSAEGQFTVTNSASGTRKFYRLVFP